MAGYCQKLWEKGRLNIYSSFLFSLYLQSTFWSQLKPSQRDNKINVQCDCTNADDNKSIAKSNECCFIETKSPSLIHLHPQHQRRQIKSTPDAVMHFSPPSKDSINTDFTNLNVISESGRNSVSRQSLIGEFALWGVWCLSSLYSIHKAKASDLWTCSLMSKHSFYHLLSP